MTEKDGEKCIHGAMMSPCDACVIKELRTRNADLEERLGNAQASLVAWKSHHEEETSELRTRVAELSDALRPFANMSECIENDKDFHIDGDCWIKAKEVLSGRNATK